MTINRHLPFCSVWVVGSCGWPHSFLLFSYQIAEIISREAILTSQSQSPRPRHWLTPQLFLNNNSNTEIPFQPSAVVLFSRQIVTEVSRSTDRRKVPEYLLASRENDETWGEKDAEAGTADTTVSAAASSDDVLTDVACSRRSLQLANVFPSLAVLTVDQMMPDQFSTREIMRRICIYGF